MEPIKEYTIKAPGKFQLNLSELKQYHELLYFFTWRDIKIKYKQTALGFLWAVLQPLLIAGILAFVLGNRNSGFINNFLPFYAGVMVWNIFASGINNAGNSMVSNANIIKKIYFPRLLLPLSSLAGTLFDFTMSIPILVAVCMLSPTEINIAQVLCTFPMAVITMLYAATGPALLLSALNVKYRDFRYVIPFLLQLLLFASPLFIKTINIPTHLKPILNINPAALGIQWAQAGFGGELPSSMELISGYCTYALFLIIGIYYFKKTEHNFADLA
ncbi:MAG: ABC transporter permease [Bacteroidetes bacterium]|jgi:lipopolysaccharide transport system permease protein|nr:ABC transporter permease [Bacteroidota bacterium]